MSTTSVTAVAEPPFEALPTEATGSDYATLVRRVRAAGLLRRRPLAYGVRGLVTLAFYGACVLSIVWVGSSWLQLINAAAMAIAYGQVAFLGHDAGHQAIFATQRYNDLLGRCLANLLTGLSYGWWVDTHNRHHANPNQEGADPDIGDGILVFTSSQAARRRGGLSRFVARNQAWLFFPLTLLEGLSLHVDSVNAVATNRYRSTRGGSRRFETVGLLVHVTLYLSVLALVMSPLQALAFVGVHQAAWGLYMSCTFAPNHKGMPTLAEDVKLDYLRRQVLTSRNVRGGWLVDIALGGLNYQIEHHLFPSMPRPALRHAQPIVRAHCRQLGLPYSETSLAGSYRAVLAHLHAIGAPLRARIPMAE